MKPEAEKWLDDPMLMDALRSIKDEAAGRTELPDSVRQAVQLRLDASLMGMVGANVGSHASGNSEPPLDAAQPAPHSTLPTAFKGALSQTSWITGLGKVIIGGLLAGGTIWALSPQRPPVATIAPASPRETIGSPRAQTSSLSNDAASLEDRGRSDTPADGIQSAQLVTSDISGTEDKSAPNALGTAVAEPKMVRPRALPAERQKADEHAGQDLNYELALLRLARAALADRPAFAREILRNYDRRFPEGALRNEYDLLMLRLETPDPSAPTLEQPSH